MRSRLLFCCFAIVFLTCAAFARAEDSDSGKFSRTVKAIDPVTLQAQDARITLWGLRPVAASETDIGLKALELIDGMIGSNPVTCRSVGGTSTDVVARCAAHSGEDLGLELLSHGYVVVDRRQDTSAVPAYMEAQRAARHNEDGVWRDFSSDDGGAMPAWAPLLLQIGTFAAVLLVAFAMHYRLNRLEALQQEEFEQTRRKETQLLARERHVLASTLEGELSENKNRIEAFLTIYGAMLENLKNPMETPKYQQGGDIVQKQPSLSKTVFEASVARLSLLDMKLAAQLSKLYAAMPKEQEYINIEPGVPLESAIALVEKVLREAEDLMAPITAGIAALEEIVASSRKFEA